MILHRVAFSLFTLLLVSAALFALARAMPVSPASIVLGDEASPAQLQAFESKHGLDLPIAEQYVRWLRGVVLEGDLGRSFVTNLSLSGEIARTFPITFELVVLSFLLAVVIAIPLGALSAIHADSAIDHVARLIGVLGVSVPGFWMGLLLIAYGAVGLGWFPPGGVIPWSAGWVEHLSSVLLPVLALGTHYIAIMSRLTRSSLLEVLAQDYIRTARAMGVPRTRILVYALKNALAPVVSIAAMSFGYMFGWALIIEYVFNIPGMSRSLLSAISQRDYDMVQTVVLVITAIFIAANLVADLLNRWLNPRTGGTA